MTKLTKEEVQRIDAELMYPFGCVVLRCDGDTVTIKVQRVKPRRYDLVIYVNGWLKSEYLKPEAKENRFYRPVKVSYYKPSERARILREFGKRRAAKLFDKLDATFTYWEPTWTSPTSMLRHFARVSESVSLVSAGTDINTWLEERAMSTSPGATND